MLDDPRILDISTKLLGSDFNYMGSDGNYYVGDTGWHSDGGNTDILHIKIAYYLDPLSRETGSVRVLPGSHQRLRLWTAPMSPLRQTHARHVRRT